MSRDDRRWHAHPVTDEAFVRYLRRHLNEPPPPPKPTHYARNAVALGLSLLATAAFWASMFVAATRGNP